MSSQSVFTRFGDGTFINKSNCKYFSAQRFRGANEMSSHNLLDVNDGKRLNTFVVEITFEWEKPTRNKNLSARL